MMVDSEEFGKKAAKHIHLADHILTQTYPLVKDPKLLLGVIKNLYRAVLETMGAILAHERLHKRIPPYQNTEESMMNMFKWKITKKYQINIEYITLFEELSDILKRHKKSPVEFTRKDKFIICTDSYKMRTVSGGQMKIYIKTARLFLADMMNIVKKHG